MKSLKIVIFGGHAEIRDKLKKIGAEFTERDVFSMFWGIEFKVNKPIGRDCSAKMKEIEAVFSPITTSWK